MTIDKELKRVAIRRQPGERLGLGVAIDVEPSSLNVALVTVISIAEGSPSAKAVENLQIGDEIVAVDGEYVKDKSRPACLKLFHRTNDQTQLLVRRDTGKLKRFDDDSKSTADGQLVLLTVEIHQRKDSAG